MKVFPVKNIKRRERASKGIYIRLLLAVGGGQTTKSQRHGI
jgi:hypothetical protein